MMYFFNYISRQVLLLGMFREEDFKSTVYRESFTNDVQHSGWGIVILQMNYFCHGIFNGQIKFKFSAQISNFLNFFGR